MKEIFIHTNNSFTKNKYVNICIYIKILSVYITRSYVYYTQLLLVEYKYRNHIKYIIHNVFSPILYVDLVAIHIFRLIRFASDNLRQVYNKHKKAHVFCFFIQRTQLFAKKKITNKINKKCTHTYICIAKK